MVYVTLVQIFALGISANLLGIIVCFKRYIAFAAINIYISRQTLLRYDALSFRIRSTLLHLCSVL